MSTIMPTANHQIRKLNIYFQCGPGDAGDRRRPGAGSERGRRDPRPAGGRSRPAPVLPAARRVRDGPRGAADDGPADPAARRRLPRR